VFSTARGPVHIRTVVQVWRRKHGPRALWQLRRTVTPCKNQHRPPAQAIIVRRVGSCKDVGKALPLHECKILSRDNKVLRTSIGSLGSDQYGTAVAFDRPIPLLRKRYDAGVIKDLLMHRTVTVCALSLTVLSAIIARDWRRLIRPIEYLDGRRRHPHQW
jgi:hypothetical protein